MDIQWYPGQMAKAKRLLRENLKLVDAVIEVLDARIPYSSRNPDIRDLIERRPVVAVLTRADLADPRLLLSGYRHYLKIILAAAAVNANRGMGVKKLLSILNKIPQRRQRSRRPLRLMVVGIPNVGKSSLINRLLGRSAAITGDKPGVTKGKQWLRLAGNLELMDTPGLLWPKISSKRQAFALAAVGAVKDEIYDPVELALELAAYFQASAPKNLQQRYKLSSVQGEARLLLEEIGRRRGCLSKGGEIDLEQAARLFIKDFREARLGRLTLEQVGEIGENNEQFCENDGSGNQPLP